MPVSTKHVDYDHNEIDWRKCRDVYEGQRAVKAAGTLYLPRLTEQTDQEYNSYKDRALFYSITSKSVGALVGMGMIRPPILKYPEAMSPYFVENSGVEFYEAFGAILQETLLMGRYGALIDRQVVNGRPQIHGYRAEAILNWRTNRDGLPYLVVLKETTLDEDQSDEYAASVKTQYRVLRLVHRDSVTSNAYLMKELLIDTTALPIVNQAGSELIYTVSIYDEKETHVSTTVPTNNGRPMNVIPFYVSGPVGIGFGVSKSPMLDIADINISHYRTSADLEHGRHFTGLPTAVVSGIEAGTKLKIGSMSAWVLPDKDAKAHYLEFTGAGLGSLENAMKEKQAQMASLSSRLLDNSANGSEAADAIRLRYMSESASLSSICRTTEAMLNRCYKTIAAMEGHNPDEVTIHLEKEFHNTRLSAADQAKMTEAYLSGGMSVETFVFNMRRGDMLSTDRTDEQEIAELNKLKSDLEAAKQKEQQSKQPQQVPPKNQPPAQS